MADLDVLIYEDMALGNLSRERYQKMAESCRPVLKIAALEDWVETREEMDDSLDQFVALVEIGEPVVTETTYGRRKTA